LYAIAKENPEHFDFFKRMEKEYGSYVALDRPDHVDEDGNQKLIHFFRMDKSVDDIFEEAKSFDGRVRDTNNQLNYQIERDGIL
jgi:hypothetical protein